MPHWFILAVYTLSVILPIMVLIISIYLRRAQRSLYFSYMALAIFVFTLGYLFEITASSERTALMATRVQYIGIPFISPLLMLFILEYCGFKLNRSLVISMLVVPVTSMLLMVTYPFQTLYYRSVEFVTNSSISHLNVVGTPLYYIFFIYTYGIAFVSLSFTIYFYKKGDTVFKRQSIILMGCTLPPLINNIVRICGLTFSELDLTPIMFSITCILLVYVITKHGMYRIAPIAREQIVETMRDGFVLTDMQDLFIDANEAAIKIVPVLAKASVGMKMDSLDGIPWRNEKRSFGKYEFSVEDPSGTQTFYRTSETIIQIDNRKVGRSIMIYDVTESRHLLDEVRMLAELDALTGLVNRGTLFNSGNSMFAKLLQTGGSGSILMMDLDHFKLINDKYGHIMGDEVLKRITQALSARFRNDDLFARYGGEELCAFLINTNRHNVIRIAESLRTNVENLHFQCGEDCFQVTISIGISNYDLSRHHTFSDLLADADVALYRAKESGRNRAVLFETTDDKSDTQ